MSDGTPTGGTPPDEKEAEKPPEAKAEEAKVEAADGKLDGVSASENANANANANATANVNANVNANADANVNADAHADENAGEKAVEVKPVEKVAEPAPATGTIELHVVGRTDVGLVREHNEDSYLVVRLDDASRDSETLRRHTLTGKGTLCVVCDGMGGAAAGEVASNMAVESMASTLLGSEIVPAPAGVSDDAKTALARKLRMAAKEANTQIFREARANLARSGMGTTMTAVLFNDDHALVAQVGDSRAYVWRKGKFTQVTRDQSLVNQLLETGHITPEQAKFFEHSNVILQALGVQEEVDVQLSKVELRKGDRFVVCSDGLVGVVTDEEIAAVVGACEDPDETGRILIELANGAGGPDNISVIVAHVAGERAPEPTDADALEYKLWKIDPEQPLATADEPITQPTMQSPDGAPTTVPRRAVSPSGDRRPAMTGSRPARNQTLELVSMAVVFGLLLGSVMTGAVIYKNGVSCHVASRQAGASVMADGRDTGIRLPVAAGDDGATRVKMRLRPGRHTVALKGQGADVQRQVDVTRGAACEIDFTDAEAHAAAPLPVTAPSSTTEAE